jgi:hypothetical protein
MRTVLCVVELTSAFTAPWPLTNLLTCHKQVRGMAAGIEQQTRLERSSPQREQPAVMDHQSFPSQGAAPLPVRQVPRTVYNPKASSAEERRLANLQALQQRAYDAESDSLYGDVAALERAGAFLGDAVGSAAPPPNAVGSGHGPPSTIGRISQQVLDARTRLVAQEVHFKDGVAGTFDAFPVGPGLRGVMQQTDDPPEEYSSVLADHRHHHEVSEHPALLYSMTHGHATAVIRAATCAAWPHHSVSGATGQATGPAHAHQHRGAAV